MNIQILGTGCYKCVRLEAMLAELLPTLGRQNVSVERIDDPSVIRRHMSEDMLPGLLINGALVTSGRLPTKAELSAWLEQAAAMEEAAPSG
jgi:hypothetical protein